MDIQDSRVLVEEDIKNMQTVLLQFNKQRESAGWDPVKVDSISIGLDFVGQEDGWVKSQIKPMVNVA